MVAWLSAVGVDFLFNAGLFSGLFDQSREPSLLPDVVLFRRIPVAYAGMAVAVTALAWLVDRTDRRGAGTGAMVGAFTGVVVTSMGIVALWTAVDITGLWVAAGAAVQVAEMAAAGATLGAYRAGADRRLVTRVTLALVLAAGVVGVLAQNLVRGGA